MHGFSIVVTVTSEWVSVCVGLPVELCCPSATTMAAAVYSDCPYSLTATIVTLMSLVPECCTLTNSTRSELTEWTTGGLGTPAEKNYY